MNFLPIQASLLQHMGSDKVVVDAARVSFAKYGELGFGQGEPSMGDAALINYLATGMRSAFRAKLLDRISNCENDVDADKLIEEIRAIAEHWTPFGHCMATFHVRAPIFVQRQITRSGVGLVPNEPVVDTAVINEESRRYVDDEPNFYRPRTWRSKPVDAKQGSGRPLDAGYSGDLTRMLEVNTAEGCGRYNFSLELGVAPEQARMFLPLNTHTEWVWTGSLYAWARVCKLRLASDAQEETREVALQISDAMLRLFPLSWRALVRGTGEYR